MSHPVLVDQIENRFVPALIFNNKKEDETKLKQFNEPSWNNPVVRFLNSSFRDVIPRKDEVWTTGHLATRMIDALTAAKKEVPVCLKLVRLESTPGRELASFAMHCYWEGEVQFGQLPGVIDTSSAWYDNQEIVNVYFDPKLTSYESLVKHAVKVRCASKVFVRTREQSRIAKSLAPKFVEAMAKDELGKPAKVSDQKYYLEASPMRLLPLTRTQAARVNSALGRRVDPKSFLSESQLKMADWLQEVAEDRSLILDLQKAKKEMGLNAFAAYVKKRMK